MTKQDKIRIMKARLNLLVNRGRDNSGIQRKIKRKLRNMGVNN